MAGLDSEWVMPEIALFSVPILSQMEGEGEDPPQTTAGTSQSPPLTQSWQFTTPFGTGTVAVTQGTDGNSVTATGTSTTPLGTHTVSGTIGSTGPALTETWQFTTP